MRIRFNEEIGTLDIDGVIISAAVLRELVNPDNRFLFRFERKDGVIQAKVFTERQCVWIENPDGITDQTAEFGMVDQKGNEEGERK
jgi:hypothetical protein